MKKFILFIALLLFPLKVEAYFCDYNHYNAALKKAQNVNIMTDYVIMNDSAIFTITIYNFSLNQSIYDKVNNRTYNYNGNDMISIEVTNPGIYSFDIFSADNYCDEKPLNTLFAEIPTYNKFYKDSLCDGIETFKYCQRWFSTPISYENFKKAIEDYKNTFTKEPEDIQEDYKSIYDYLLEFYVNYWFIILPMIIIGGTITIIIKRKKENKFNL